MTGTKYACLVWAIYFAGFLCHSIAITALCIAFGLINLFLGYA